METVSRFLHPPEASFFLLGPRGTGKSTWLRSVFPDAVFVDLLRPDTLREMIARPERLAELAAAREPGTTLVLDEVQRAPELLPVVHGLLESRRRLRFVLTGSSARKLRRGGTDLLGGRAVLRTMHPFMAGELRAFDLSRALVEGMLPVVLDSRNPGDVLRGYAALYLEQEVRAEALVRRIADFARFLEVVTFSHGSVLNVANVARECAIERKTVNSWLEVLDDLLLAFTLPVFTKRASRELVAHPRFYLFDAGVFHSLRPKGPLDRPEEIAGAALEGLVAQHLRAWIAWSDGDMRLFYWRTRRGVEVDFVVSGEEGIWAIQVQNSREVRQADLRSLNAFRQDYPACTAILLHRGEERFVRDGVSCVPVQEFLEAMTPGRPLTPAAAPRGDAPAGRPRAR